MNPYPNGHDGRSRQRRTTVIVLALVVLYGVLGIILTPPGSTPDVWAHVYRVDAMLNGDVIARPVRAASDYHPDAEHNTGGWVDDDVVAFSLANDRHYVSGLVDAASVTVRDGRRSEVPFDNTAVYPPIAYLPQLAVHLSVVWIGLRLLAGVTGVLALSKFAYAPCLLMTLLPMVAHCRTPVRSWRILVTGCVLPVMLLLAWLKLGTGFATNPSRVPYDEVLQRQRELLTAPHRFLPRMFYSITHLQGWSWWEPPLLLLFWTLTVAALTLTVIVWRRDRRRLLFWLMSWILIIGCVTLVYAAIWTQFTLTGQTGRRHQQPILPTTGAATGHAVC